MVAKVRDMMKTRGRSQLSEKGQNKNANQAKGNATMHANRQRKCKQEIKKARHKMNGILYEFTENISCSTTT